jgi:Txe/YoeB family toxin of Txe-Axe toxin-antitoxin module
MEGLLQAIFPTQSPMSRSAARRTCPGANIDFINFIFTFEVDRIFNFQVQTHSAFSRFIRRFMARVSLNTLSYVKRTERLQEMFRGRNLREINREKGSVRKK